MANEVQINNLALSHINARSIQSLNDPTKEARQCKLLYPFARDATLEDHDWTFARKTAVLALLPDTYLGYDYAYQKPSDCLVPRRIFDPSGLDKKIEYEVMTVGDNQIVLTNQENAELVYTRRVTDANLYSALYIEAVAYRLAADLAQPIKGKTDIFNIFMQRYFYLLSKSKASNSNSEEKKPNQQNDLLDSRN